MLTVAKSRYYYVSLVFLLGCNADSSVAPSPKPEQIADRSSSSSIESEAKSQDITVIGRWEHKSEEITESGKKSVTIVNFDYRADGTHTIDSTRSMFHGSDGELIFTATTTESGTWSVEGDKVCWNTGVPELAHFESNTDNITREIIEDALKEETDTSSTCMTFVSSDSSKLVLLDESDGQKMILDASEVSPDP